VPLIDIVLEDHVAVIPKGSPEAIPIPVPPVVA
jgi:hypothetical protein